MQTTQLCLQTNYCYENHQLLSLVWGRACRALVGGRTSLEGKEMLNMGTSAFSKATKIDDSACTSPISVAWEGDWIFLTAAQTLSFALTCSIIKGINLTTETHGLKRVLSSPEPGRGPRIRSPHSLIQGSYHNVRQLHRRCRCRSSSCCLAQNVEAEA